MKMLNKKSILLICIAIVFAFMLVLSSCKFSIKNQDTSSDTNTSTSTSTDSGNNSGSNIDTDSDSSSDTDSDFENDTPSAPHEHSYSEWETTKEATCTEEGAKQRKCSCGEVEAAIIPISDHDHKELIYEDGYCLDKRIVSVYCSMCGELVSSYGHSYEKTITNATCTKNGIVSYSCVYCNDTYSNSIPATGHVESEYQELTKATCEDNGYFVSKCLVCEVVISEATAEKLDHVYVSTLSGDTLTYSCTRCQNSYSETVNSDVHKVTFVSDGKVVCEMDIVDGESIENLPELQKDGYILSFWDIEQDANSPYAGHEIYEPTTLYAVWEEAIIIDTVYSDVAVYSSVDTDFVFIVIADSQNQIKQSLSIFDVSDNKIAYDVTSLGNGRFEISSDEYMPSNHYFAKLGDACSFEGTESREIQIAVKGEDRFNISVYDGVNWLHTRDIIAILTAEDGSCILTNAQFNVGDNVVVYDKDYNDIKIAIKILKKIEISGQTAYIFDIADYDEVFENFDVSFSGGASNGQFEINGAAEEEIKERFLRSSTYKAIESASERLAKDLKIGYEIVDGVKVSIGESDGDIVGKIYLEEEFDDHFTIYVSISFVATPEFDYDIEGLTNYSAVVGTATTFNINFGIKGSEDNNYSPLANKYKDILNTFEKYINDEIAKDTLENSKRTNKQITLGHYVIPVGYVNVEIDVRIDFDFEISGQIGLNSTLILYQEIGVRNGSVHRTWNFEVSNASVYALAKLETDAILELEVFVNVAGIGIYGSIGGGPYLEIALAGGITITNNKLQAPQGGYYIDLGYKFEYALGFKIEFLEYVVFEKSISNENLYTPKWHAPGFPKGNEKIYIDFVSPEDEYAEYNASCDQIATIDLSKIVDIAVIYQNMAEDMSSGTEQAEKVQYSIVSTSGYRSKITLREGVLTIRELGEDVTIVILVKVNDIIYKELTLVYKVEHIWDCNHFLCADGYHRGGRATCTDKAICERCGLEYGEEPKGHVFEEDFCTKCYMIEPGKEDKYGRLEYTLLNDGTYAVTGIGTYSASVLYIPSEYEGVMISAVGGLKDCDSLTKVIIGNGVTSIGEDAFYSCGGLTSVVIPNSVTTIDDYAFAYCTNLTDIEIPNSVTSIGYFAFGVCSRLMSIVIPNNITSIDDVTFSGCSSLASIVIPNSVTSIGRSAFKDCDSLTSIVIPDSVTNIGDWAFERCDSLTIYCKAQSQPSGWKSSWNSSSCPVVWDCNINNVADDGYIYTVTDGVRYAIKDGEATVVKQPENIVSAIIQSSINYKNRSYSVVRISERAFEYCDNLTSITIGNSVTSIGDDAFFDCASLINIIVDENNTQYKSIDGNLYSKDGKTLIQYAIGKDDTHFEIPNGVTSIGNYAFSSCDNLTSIVIPDSVTSIGNSAFYDCGSLISVTIGNSVTSIGNKAFYDCDSLTNITIGNSVTSIGEEAFYSCEDLTSVYVNSIESWCNISFEDSTSNPLIYGKNLYLDGNLVTDLVIPNTVTELKAFVFYSYSNLTSIDMPNSIIYIGDYAFSNCSSLTKVTIGNGVTSIGDWAFYDCNSLTKVTIGNSVTSIGADTFESCNNLTSIVIPDSVTSIGEYAFSGCSSLTSIVIPDSVTSISDNTFSRCVSLTNVTLGNGVTTIGEGAFGSCRSLTNVSLGNGVTSIGSSAFSSCESLTSVVIPNSVTSIGDCAFLYCDSLTNVTIGNSVTSIGGWAFEYCSSLTSIAIPDSVTSIGYGVFQYCDSLTNVNLGNGVTSIGEYVFYECSNLTSVTIGNSVTSIGRFAFSECSNLTSMEIPNSVTIIGDDAFFNCNSLTSVTIGNSVTSIGKSAFRNCESLTSIVIPDSVTSIGSYAFEDCYDLTSVNYLGTIEQWCKISFESSVVNLLCNGADLYLNGELVTEIVIPNTVSKINDYAFSDCDSLTSIVIPDSVTSIGSYAFESCDSLTIYCEAPSKPSGWDSYWNISDCPVVWDCKNNNVANDEYIYTVIDGIRYGIKDNIATVVRQPKNIVEANIPSAITYKDTVYPVTSIGEDAFSGCKSLTSIVIPNSVTSIRNSAFSGCDSLTSIVIPDSVTSIGNYAFNNCESLISVTIGNSVTSIGYKAFYDCDSLKSVTIGNSVTSIGYEAFSYCDSLTNIVIPDSVTSIGEYAFSYCDSLTIYCEVRSRPSTWSYYWNYSGGHVVWGHVHAYENGECVCGMKQ